MKPIFTNVGIVGAGAMGRGIAQIAAQAGSNVLLFDLQPDSARSAQVAVFEQWEKLCQKGRLSEDQVGRYKSHLLCAASLDSLKDCDLVVEAVIERLDVKAELFAKLVTYARQMGHTPVQAQDTPGFIVNHAGRGYGTEALRIVSEGVADFATVDRILKDQIYRYEAGIAQCTPEPDAPVVANMPPVWVSPRASRRPDTGGSAGF